MKNTLSPRLVKFANTMAKIPFVKTLLKPLYYPYKEKINKRRNVAFKAHALDTLAAFDACMQKHNIKYTLIFGSMLGAVREKGFIKHDMDIDVAVWKEDYFDGFQKCLEEDGFKLDHMYLIDDGESAREETYVMNDVSIDVFCIFPPIDEYPYICSKWAPVEGCVTKKESMKKHGYITGKRLELPISKNVVYADFENIKLPISENAHEVLAFYYGEDYMNSNPSWTEKNDYPYRKSWPEKKAVLMAPYD